jgi:nucleoside-diphosphate-sugar epimerase
MRVLILGGTGLTGPYVVRRLAGLGHEVTVFHRGGHEADLPPAVRHIHGSMDDLPPALREAGPDVVVHMWAMTEQHARIFVDCFGGVVGRAVVISSGDVYRAYGRLKGSDAGPPDPVPLSEEAPLRQSRYPYGGEYDKILVEQVLRAQSALPVTILRFPAVYGPNDAHRFRPWVRPMLVGVPELKVQDGFARWRWTHGYAEDVAGAVVLAAIHFRAAGRTYNVGEPETPTWAERLRELGQAAGWRGRIVPVPAEELPPDQRSPLDLAQNLVTDTRRIRDELGYREVVPRAEGYRRTVEWEASPRPSRNVRD